MSSEIIVKNKTEIAKNSHRKDILTLYGVPACLDKITEKERLNLLNMLDCGAIVTDSLNQIAHSEGFFVEIPKGLREALQTGKATLDKSGKNFGSYTPNIRIKGENGIKGQVTISKGCDSQAITRSLVNLAMMFMVQSVLEKLDAIEEKLDDVKQGQKNDRIGSIIGPFKSFFDLYPTFQSKTELDIEANATYRNMQIGLGQLHFQIEEERKKLSSAPSDLFKLIIMSIKHPFYFFRKKNKTDYYKDLYSEYVYDIQLYNRLILLSDIILYLKGCTSEMQSNYAKMQEYCQLYIDEDFRKNMKFLMQRPLYEIDKIDNYNENYQNALERVIQKDLFIEYKKEDVKLLSQK